MIPHRRKWELKMKPTPSDPAHIAFSTAIYRLLLTFYPPPFQREYGPHMAQVFRDSCLRTYRHPGPPGLLSLWVLTIWDWFKTVIEEQLSREVNLSRKKLIRLSGWGLMVGPVALFIGLGDPTQFRNFLIHWLGAPDGQSGTNTFQFVTESVLIILMMIGLGSMFFGFWGLFTNYCKKVRKLGRFSLRLIVIGSGTSVLGGAFSIAGTDWWWFIFIAGFFSIFVFLTFFGLIALRDKPLPCWNGLPFLTGIWLPGMLVIGGGLGWDKNPSFTMLSMLIALLGLIITGYILQADTGESAMVA
jgi:hypothetical protein